MPAPVLGRNPTQVKLGPGLIISAAASVALPALVAAASKFTTTFTDFVSMGYTDEGATLVFNRESEDVEVAEEDNPIKRIGTKVGVSLQFAAAGINETNIIAANAGGVWSTVGGTGATQVRKYAPPKPSDQTRRIWAHIGNDLDEVFVIYQGYQTGEITMSRKKGAAKASLSGFNIVGEVPDPLVSVDVWNYFYAGEWAAPLTAYA
jgi:hypothetical protein